MDSTREQTLREEVSRWVAMRKERYGEQVACEDRSQPKPVSWPVISRNSDGANQSI